MKRPAFFAFLLALCAALPLAAQRTVTGKVTDRSTDRPLPNVSVLVEGRAASTRTDATGSFRLEVPPGGQALLFSLPGYANSTVALTSGNVYDITLRPLAPAPDTTETAANFSLWDTIPIARIAALYGQVELSQLLTFADPRFQSTRQALAEASDHVDPVQLRGMGPDQVLVLVNGKRRHQSALVHTGPTPQRGMAQGADWNAIPLAAIERIEVLRDVVGTEYGSDAVAGVVNIVLKNKPGLDASVSYGQRVTEFDKNLALFTAGQADRPGAKANDGQTWHAGLHYGFDLGDRGRLNLTGEYLRRGATNRAGTYDGQIYPLNSNGANEDSLLLAQRGLTREDFDMQLGEARMQGGGAFYDLDLTLNESWNLYSFGGFYQKNGRTAGFYQHPFNIEQLTGFVAGDFVFPEYPDGFLPETSTKNRDLGATLGLRGHWGDWSLDLSNTFGQNRLDFDVDQSINYTEREINSGPPQTAFDAGGLKLSQNTANLELSRWFEQALAGLRVAAGLEHRLERYAIRSGEELSWVYYEGLGGAIPGGAQGFRGFNDSSGTHSRNSIGVYLRAEQHFTPDFSISATGRFDRYSDFGNTVNGKLTLRYQLAPAFELHASGGTGFRAPALQQTYFLTISEAFASSGVGSLYLGRNGIFSVGSPAAQLFETPDLKPEQTLGFSAGLSWRPAGGFSLTLDAWQVSVKDRIVLTNDFGRGAFGTPLDTAFRNLDLQTVRFWANAIATRSQGVEARLAWGKTFGEQRLQFGASTAFYQNEVRTDANGNLEIEASPVALATDQVDQYFNDEDQNRLEGALPRLKIVANAGYQIGAFGADLRATYFGAVRYRAPNANRFLNEFTGEVGVLDQDFGGKMLLDLSLSYAFTPGVRLLVGAHNLLDTYPDRHAHSVNVNEGRVIYSTQAQQFGYAGRYLFVRVAADLGGF